MVWIYHVCFFLSFGCYPSQSHVNECVNACVCAYFELNYMFIGCAQCIHAHNSNRVLSLLFLSCTTTVPIKSFQNSFFRNSNSLQKFFLRLNSSRNFSAVTYIFVFDIFIWILIGIYFFIYWLANGFRPFSSMYYSHKQEFIEIIEGNISNSQI